MKPTDIVPVTLTIEEIQVALAMMQLGLKTQGGDAFDNATASYLHLRNKLVQAQNAAAEAAKAAPVNDNVVPITAAE